MYVHICMYIYKHTHLYDKKVDSDCPLDKVSPLTDVAQNEEGCPKFIIFIYMSKEFLTYLRHDTFETSKPCCGLVTVFLVIKNFRFAYFRECVATVVETCQ